jgi:hypothetical protein
VRVLKVQGDLYNRMEVRGGKLKFPLKVIQWFTTLLEDKTVMEFLLRVH